MSKKYTEDVIQALKAVVSDCEKEDRSVRERQLRTWRRLKLFWEGFQNVWYSEVAHDWRIWDQEQASDTDQSAYDTPVNVFRAYLESIIAALSVVVPPVKCFPDDADNTLDLATANAGDKIAQLVYRHNDVSLLWLHALFLYCTEGMVACYGYPKEDESYGTYSKRKYDEQEEMHEVTSCPLCGFTIEDKALSPEEQAMQANSMEAQTTQPPNEELINQEKDEFMPDDEDVELHDMINRGVDMCPSCMQMMDPEIKQDSFIVTRLVGITTEPKSRICLEAYGGLFVQVPNYAKRQSECPYLIFSEEMHYAMALEKFEDLERDELKKDLIAKSAGAYDQYDQWARLSPQYQGEYPINVVTVKRAWLRPASFNVLDEEQCKLLKKKFPDGAKVTLVNGCFAEACNEALDDCWTLTYNPLADYVHYDPLGLLLTSIQEITNDLISLTRQTIEHGVGLTFADPAVLNFKSFEQTEVTPGGVFPATPKSGKSLSDAFYEIKTATLSSEVLPFAQNIQSLGQLVSGALPSLFGGQLEGTETASEYSMSRAQARQRIQNIWKIFNAWWKQVFGKVIPMYIKEVKEDERDVQRDSDGNFVNVLIRKAELEGKIGRIEIDSNENLPLDWAQQKDIVMQLLQAANPEILKVIGSPENLPIIREAIGLTDFYVPGEDDRNEQYDEIKMLLNSEPIQTGDPLMPEMPSVDIDPMYNNHPIHFEIVRKWASSEAGRQAKVDKPEGYKNVLLHGKLHFMQMNPPQIDPNMAPNGEGAPSEGKPANQLLSREAPITGEQNVSTIQ